MSINLDFLVLFFCRTKEESQKTKCSSRKRKYNEDEHEDDIFTSLLKDGIEVEDGLNSSHSNTQNFSRVASVQPEFSLLTANIVKDILFAFAIHSNDRSKVSLMVWKQLEIPSTQLKFDSVPTAIVTHDHSSPLQSSSHLPLPFMVITCGSEGIDEGVARIDEVLYAYLFGHEDALSKSLIVLYGWVCGCVLACSLKRCPSESRVMCSLDQAVVSVYSFRVGVVPHGDPHNALLFIGSAGKVVVFVSHESQVLHHQVLVSGPVLSTLISHDSAALLLSSLDSVQKICLKEKCGLQMQADKAKILRIFENPMMVFHSPVYLLCFASDSSTLLAATLEGRVVSLSLSECKSSETEASLSPESVGILMKESLLSIKSSSEQLAVVQQDTASVNDALVSLNDTLSLFRKISAKDSTSGPFQCYAEIVYEQIGVTDYKPHLQFTLLYSGLRPLREGISLIIEACPGELGRSQFFVKPKMSSEDNSVAYSQTVPLGGLQNGGKLRLRLSIPSHFYLNSRLSISCYCSYNPPLPLSMQQYLQNLHEHRIAMVHMYEKHLTPLDFLSPVSPNQPSSLHNSHHGVSFTIGSATLLKLVDQTVTDLSVDQGLHPRLLSCLFSDSETCRERVEACVVRISDVLGLGLELKALSYSGLVLFRLYGYTESSGDYSFVVFSSSLESSLVVCDELAQRLQRLVSVWVYCFILC